MKCHSIDCGTPKIYRVVLKCKYFALNTLRGTKTQDFNPKEVRRASPPFLYGSSPPGVIYREQAEFSRCLKELKLLAETMFLVKAFHSGTVLGKNE